MQVNNFIHYLDHSEQISAVTEDEITPIINEFPYCQTGQLMYAIQLNANNSILFEEQLKKAASVCSDRVKLYEYIHETEKILSIKEELHDEKAEKSTKTDIKQKDSVFGDEKFAPSEGKDELSILEKEYLSQAISSTIIIESSSEAVEIGLGKEIEEINLFDENSTHSFSSWLKYYDGGESNVVNSTKERNQELIHKFIQEDPRIQPKKTKFYSPENMANLSVSDSGIVSETLALIHVDQGNFQAAINAYEKLSLKNPKKRSYFAAQIKILKQKIK